MTAYGHRDWSYKELLAQFGGDEERALEALSSKKGFGRYAPNTNHAVKAMPTQVVHGEVHIDATGPSDLDLANLARIGGSLPSRLHNTPSSVGDRCGTPWYGEPLPEKRWGSS